MSAVLEPVMQENLFSVLASNQTFDEPVLEKVPAESNEPTEPVISEVVENHPAAKLVEAYEAAIKGVGEVNVAIRRYRELCDSIDHQREVAEIDDHDAWKVHKSAIRKTVMAFKLSCMNPEASIDALVEYEEIVGERQVELVSNFNAARREFSEEQLRDFRVDLIGLWDGLAAKFADGGIRLARSQAAKELFKKFNLERSPFKIENGKAQLVTYVYCERKFNSKEHEYTLSSRRSVEEFRKPLTVFLEFAELEDCIDIAIHEAIGVSWATPVKSGLKCIASPGHIEFKTFLREWKWTLSEHAAVKLREFIAEYANLGN
jgi:hypothetical protein